MKSGLETPLPCSEPGTFLMLKAAAAALWKRAPILCLAAAAMMSAGARPAAAAAFGLDAYLGFRQATRTAVRPDGAVAFAVERNDLQADARRSEIWLADRRGAAPRLLAEGTDPAWCAGRLAYLAVDGPVRHLRLAAGQGQDARAIDTLHVAGFRCDPAHPRAALVASESAPSSDPRAPAPTANLYLLDFASGAVRRLSDASGLGGIDWSPDGAMLAAEVNGDIELIAMDGTRSPLVRRPGLDAAPLWSPDGQRIAFATRDGNERGPVALAIVPRAGGQPAPVGRAFTAWLLGQAPRWFDWADDETLLFEGLADMTTHLYRVNLSRPAEAADLTPGERVLSGCSLDRGAAALACISSTPTSPPEVVLFSPGGARQRILTQLNPSLPASAGNVRRLHWRSADGTPVQGLLELPASGCARLCPLVVLMVGSHGVFDLSYTGRTSADDTWFPPVNQHLLLGAGYAVLMPNPRGSWSFGRAFQELITGDPAIGVWADIEAGADAAVAAGVADPTRMAIVGTGIYDAYRVAFGLTRTNRYKAAIVTFPIFDLAAWYGDSQGLPRRYLGGSPLSEPDRFAAIDPARNVPRMATPVLIFSSDQLPAMRLQGRMMATALRDRAIEVEEAPYPELFVEWPRPAALRAAAQSALGWLGRHLAAAGGS